MLAQRQEPVVGWLTGPDEGAQWPGVLLHRDAFVVDAPLEVLQEPSGGLAVVLGSALRRIAEIRVIADHSTSPSHATAMVRLADDEPEARSVVIDRPAVIESWRAGDPLWSTLRSLGVVPTRWPDSPGRGLAGHTEPSAIAVKTVQADPADWCTIFWWLC